MENKIKKHLFEFMSLADCFKSIKIKVQIFSNLHKNKILLKTKVVE